MSANGKPKDKFDLEERLIDFAAAAIELAEALPRSRAGNHVADQLIRSGTSPASNYGEAQSAESRRDFIHKMKVALKELRETKVWLRLLLRTAKMQAPEDAQQLLGECEELIRIFAKSVLTAQANAKPPGSK